MLELIRTTYSPLKSIAENNERILNILQEISDKKVDIGTQVQPIHCLLSVGPLARTEIPLDVLNQLISAGFEMNSRYRNYIRDGYVCLDIAVDGHHYNAIRLLVKCGAQSNSDNCWDVMPPVTALATQDKVPLDLFNLLATPENLNNLSPSGRVQLPLHTAASCGHIQAALHLIKLGASVDQQDGWSKLPIEHLVENQSNLLNNELFMSLLPQKGHGVSILRTIFGLQRYKRPDKDNACLLEMFHQLLQRLRFNEPLRVEFKTSHEYLSKRGFPRCIVLLRMEINNVEFYTSKSFCYKRSFDLFQPELELLDMYLCSLVLMKLQVHFISTPKEFDEKFKQ